MFLCKTPFSRTLYPLHLSSKFWLIPQAPESAILSEICTGGLSSVTSVTLVPQTWLNLNYHTHSDGQFETGFDDINIHFLFLTPSTRDTCNKALTTYLQNSICYPPSLQGHSPSLSWILLFSTALYSLNLVMCLLYHKQHQQTETCLRDHLQGLAQDTITPPSVIFQARIHFCLLISQSMFTSYTLSL